MEEFGAALRRLRGDLSIRRLATMAHCSKSYITELEQGRRFPSVQVAEALDRALDADGSLLAVHASNQAITETPRTTFSANTTFQFLHVGDNPDMAAITAFRSADLKVGGGYLYDGVVKYLQNELTPRIFGVFESEESQTFAAATSLTEMAGWMAHDSGRDSLAQRHFSRTLPLANASGDRQLTAHALGSMSHLANHQNHPQQAIALSRKGQSVIHGDHMEPAVQARLLAMEARGFAALRQPDECLGLLRQAETTLAEEAPGPRSPWVNNFDEGSFASEAVRCMLLLGDHAEAQRQAERIIALRPAERARSRAFGKLALSMTLVHRGAYDDACIVAQEVIDSTRSFGSFLIIRQIRELRSVLAKTPASKSEAVKEFMSLTAEYVETHR